MENNENNIELTNHRESPEAPRTPRRDVEEGYESPAENIPRPAVAPNQKILHALGKRKRDENHR
jgi:hypothetical protein